jgi:hypothetical protein
MTVFTEVQFIYSFLTREVMLFHAVNGPFPLNPIGFAWRVTTDGVVVDQGTAQWNIGWQMTRYDAKRFYQTKDFLAAAATGYAGVAGLLAAGIYSGLIYIGASSQLATILLLASPAGIIAAVILSILALFGLFGSKKPPAQEPRPQWASPSFFLPVNVVVFPTTPSKFKIIT